MLIIDQLNKNDRPLRLLTLVVLAGVGVLLGGLWYVQIVASKRYVQNQRAQSFRTVRIPAVRGKILDRHGVPLADNRPAYSISFYLEDKELRELFTAAYQRAYAGLRAQPLRRLNREERAALARHARYSTASNVVQQLSELLHQPVPLDEKQFQQHYDQRLALPLPVLQNLNPLQIARFQEQARPPAGLDLEVRPLRVYPYGTAAAHLVGYLTREDISALDEDAGFNYLLPDFKGISGMEAAFEQELRGKAGVKSVLVNSLGYRQSETIWQAAEPGRNIVLTIDLGLQQTTEAALRSVGPNVRAAAVVLNPQNGDILALASSPAFDPNQLVPSIAHEEWEKLNDPRLRPLLNRAIYGSYPPGSIFKIVVALAGLESGVLDPSHVLSSPGFFQLGRRSIKDTAPPGDYDFRRAFLLSCNTYFIHYGLAAGLENILKIGQRLHLGERADVLPFQEVAGFFPTLEWKQRKIGEPWRDGDTANLCIGQGYITVTPLQMAIMTAAVANGGKVLWPRLVDRIQPQDSGSEEPAVVFPAGRVRDELGVSARSLEIVRAAMLADVEAADGTGKEAFVRGIRVCGKTGTAQIKHGNVTVDHITWFVSFAPYENPRYVVVVMVESGGSGGGTCAPVAKKIYTAIQNRESTGKPKPETMARLP